MAGITTFLANELADEWLRGNAYTFPTTLYFALGATAADDGTFTGEFSYGNYARVAVAQGTGNWSSPSGGSSSLTTGNLEFGANNSGGSVTAQVLGVFDAASGGNLLAWGDIDPDVVVAVNDIPFVGSGDVTWDNNNN